MTFYIVFTVTISIYICPVDRTDVDSGPEVHAMDWPFVSISTVADLLRLKVGGLDAPSLVCGVAERRPKLCIAQVLDFRGLGSGQVRAWI